jgi:uncharacterized protein (DUF433 family)
MAADVVQMFFPLDEAARLAGITVWRVKHWIERGVHIPERATAARPLPLFLTFRDVVALRVLGILRSKKVSVRELVASAAVLREHHDSPWAALRFLVGNRRVYWTNPETGKIENPPTGQQTTEGYPLEKIVAKLTREVKQARSRKVEDRGEVVSVRGVMGGQPCIKGTRIPSRTIADFAAAGYSIPQILREYPQLNRADVLAALKYEKKAKSRKKAA